MVAECIQHTGTNGPIILPVNPSKRMDESNYFAEFGGETIDPENLRYPLTVGENYPVYGIMFYDGEIRYLISGDNGIPFFFPNSMFRISQPQIPFDWTIAEYQIEKSDCWTEKRSAEECNLGKKVKLFLLAYDTLTENYTNLIELISCCPQAVRTYLKYKDSLKSYFPMSIVE